MSTITTFKFIAITTLSCLCFIGSSNAQNSDEDDLILLVPSIIASSQSQEPALPPQWTVVNEVCCSVSSATYSATIDGRTRSSALASCSAPAPSVPEFIDSVAGQKTVQSILTSSGCGDFPFSTFQVPFEESTSYVFQSVFNESNDSIEVNVLFAERTELDSSVSNNVNLIMNDANVKKLQLRTIDVKALGAEGKFQSINR